MLPGPATVLLVNKFFYQRAGAETAYFHTRDLLRAKGHRVLDFAMEDPQNLPSDQASYFAPARSYEEGSAGRFRRVRDAGATIYSWAARRALSRLLDQERPDVAHLHNVYHQLTLSVVDELHARGIPIVQTLHDYKIACPAYTLFTDGKPCRRCVESNVSHAITHKCVKGSSGASALAALEAAVAHRRGTYSRVGYYIAPSRFAGSVAEAAGIPSNRVRFLPYFLPDREIGPPPPTGSREPRFFFGGRLDETKGVRQLLAAFARADAPATLRIAGWGSLEQEVVAAAANSPRIEFLGSISRAQVLEELGRSRALLLPSVWEDNCPLIMLEARARATPVIASSRGGPPEFVADGEDGFVVDPDDIGALTDRINRFAADSHYAEACGRRGRERLLDVHGVEPHYEGLMQVYADALARARS